MSWAVGKMIVCRLLADQVFPDHDLASFFAMTTSDEFAFIAQQLEWLEQHVRSLPPAKEAARIEGALNALTCARAVIVELSTIGRDAAGPAQLAEAA